MEITQLLDQPIQTSADKGTSYLSEWCGYIVSKIELYLVERPISLAALIAADIVLAQVALRIASKVFSYFPKAQYLTSEKKWVKTISVLSTLVFSYVLLNIAFIKGFKLNIPTPLVFLASSVVLATSLYLKKPIN